MKCNFEAASHPLRLAQEIGTYDGNVFIKKFWLLFRIVTFKSEFFPWVAVDRLPLHCFSQHSACPL